MKKTILFAAFAFITSFAIGQSSEVDTLIHKGKYNGEDLEVKNYMDSKHGYSVKEVWVNGKIQREPTNSGTFKVMLSKMGIPKEEEYTVKIVYYTSSTKPQIL